MKEFLPRDNEMDMEQKFIKIQIFIQENLKKIKRKVQVYIFFNKEGIIMGNFQKKKEMDMDVCLMKMIT